MTIHREKIEARSFTGSPAYLNRYVARQVSSLGFGSDFMEAYENLVKGRYVYGLRNMAPRCECKKTT